MEFLSDITHWHWLALGFTLIAIEILLSSAIFLWPGIAAIIIGLLSFTSPEIPTIVYILLWAVMSVAFALGWQAYRKKRPARSSISTMNKRGTQYVGSTYTLTSNIVNGTGSLNVDDTRWKIVSAKDLGTGSKVKVVAVEGTSLRVEELSS